MQESRTASDDQPSHLTLQKVRESGIDLLTHLQRLRSQMDISEVEELVVALPKFAEQLANMQPAIEATSNAFASLGHLLSAEDLSLQQSILTASIMVQETMELTKAELEVAKLRTQVNAAGMLEDAKAMLEEAADLQVNVSAFLAASTADKEDAAERLSDRAQETAANACIINRKQRLFGMKVTDFSQIRRNANAVKPYCDFFRAIKKWNSCYPDWLHESWSALDSDAMTDKVREMSKVITEAFSHFKDSGDQVMAAAAEKVLGEIDDFSPYVKLARALDNMTEQELTHVCGKAGIALPPLETLTLQAAFDLGLNECKEVTSGAFKGKEVKMRVAAMKTAWQTVNAKIEGSSIDLEDVDALLKDQVLQTEWMRHSPLCSEWADTLRSAEEIVSECRRCQQSSQDPYPPGFQQKYPESWEKAQSASEAWKQILAVIKEQSSFLHLAKKEGFLESLSQCAQLLEGASHSLNSVLEQQCVAFPRFFFESNSSLLELLSEERALSNASHLFEGVESFVTTPSGSITGICGADGEVVSFLEPVGTAGKDAATWLKEVEVQMRESLKQAVKRCLEDAGSAPWQRHPGQVVLSSWQVLWAAQVVEAFSSLPKYAHRLSSQLAETVAVLRTQLPKVQAAIVNALLVIQVHAADVVRSLVEGQASAASDFQWKRQLRLCWAGDLEARCGDTQTAYQYEYIGNPSRLVLTPLTERCFLSLTCAMRYHRGSALCGPAGTGKTETAKELARYLGTLCIVFNCSDQVSHSHTRRIFAGAAASGAFICFDEFNRIELNQIVVIGAQVQQLLSSKRKAEGTCLFEGMQLQIHPVFTIVMTMNPGYAGRTELPDNFKLLFRVIACHVPDVAVITEVLLYSHGFFSARSLAKKIALAFRLCVEKLSRQRNYDFGMRAMKAVIIAAARFRTTETAEEQAVLRALLDVGMPRMVGEDVKMYRDILKDLFPSIAFSAQGNLSIAPACTALGLQPTEVLAEKVRQLRDTLLIRHSVMLVGPPGSGKTSCRKILKATLGDVEERILNPVAVTGYELYGSLENDTWKNGLIPYELKKAQAAQSNYWIVLDGPVDPMWAENLNTVMDDNKKLCLSTGEIIALSENTRLLFEVENLNTASPAQVSRCGVVYCDPLDATPLLQSWASRYPPALHAALLVSHEVYTAPLRSLLVDNSLCQSLWRILQCLLSEHLDGSEENMKDCQAHLDHFFIYAVTWSFGSSAKDRRDFNAALRDIISSRTLSPQYPADGTVFDWYFDFPSKQYRQWVTSECTVDTKLSFSEIFVPTIESVRVNTLCTRLLTRQYSVLVRGPTAAGKSKSIEQLLEFSFDHVTIPFSKSISTVCVRSAIESRLSKRRKGVWGPPFGQVVVVFAEDMNLPQKSRYGSQPPLEFMRQFIEHKSWHDKENMTNVEIEDVATISAANGPLPARLLRHFSQVSYSPLSEDDCSTIFTTILRSAMRSSSDAIQGALEQAVKASFQVCSALSSPSKSYNARNLARIFQGMAYAPAITDYSTFLKLWAHEHLREFGDQSRESCEQVMKLLQQALAETLAGDPSAILGHGDITFADFVTEDRSYVETEPAHLIEAVNEYAASYLSAEPLTLLAKESEHVSRLCRGLRQGSLLLFANPGDNRSTLAKLATFIMGYELQELDVSLASSTWRSILQSCLETAGVKNEPIVLLFPDAHNIPEQVKQDIVSVLKHGEVSGSSAEEVAARGEGRRSFLRANIRRQYLRRVRRNLHFVLVGLQKSPTLANYCTVDWFGSWSSEALVAVARRQLRTEAEGTALGAIHRAISVTFSLFIQLFNTFLTLLADSRACASAQRLAIEKLTQALDAAKLSNSEELASALEREIGVRTAQVEAQNEALVGDCVLSAAEKIYLNGLPTATYQESMNNFRSALSAVAIKYSVHSTLPSEPIEEDLAERLTAILVEKDQKDIVETKATAFNEGSHLRAQLEEAEAATLKVLSRGGDLLAVLATCESTFSALQEKSKELAAAKEALASSLARYRPAGTQAAHLFPCVQALATLSPLYEFSQEWFIGLWEKAADNAPKSDDLEQRLKNVNDYFISSLFENVSYGLLTEHKLVFPFLLAARTEDLNSEEWSFFLTKPTATASAGVSPVDWLTDSQFTAIRQRVEAASHLPSLRGLNDSFTQSTESWKEVLVNEKTIGLPVAWQHLTPLQQFIVIKSLRPDKVILALKEWISRALGPQFAEAPTVSVASIISRCYPRTPLLCTLSRFEALQELLAEKEKVSVLNSVQLARKAVDEHKNTGGWVVFQNISACELQDLGNLINTLDDSTHPDFRLLLDIQSSDLPATLVQRCEKVVLRAPQGLRAHLSLAYSAFLGSGIASSNSDFQALAFSLCMFHAVVQERKRVVGWGQSYEFSLGDLLISIEQLRDLLDKGGEVYQELAEMVASVHYGGKLTDEWSRRTMLALVRTFVCPEARDADYKFSESGIYRQPSSPVLSYIESLPETAEPEVLGLHANASISAALKETEDLLKYLGKVKPIEFASVADLLARIPPSFDVAAVRRKHSPDDPLSLFLLREVTSYQSLLDLLNCSLASVQSALSGDTAMTDETESIIQSLRNNEVPQCWQAKAFPSLLPLEEWMCDLHQRVTSVADWVNNGAPSSFWLPGLFSPHEFFTAVLETYARKHQVDLASLAFDFKVVGDSAPEDGCYVSGLWLEGARWDAETQTLSACKPGELYSPLPVLHCIPSLDHSRTAGSYLCPLLRNCVRRGLVSTNYVTSVNLPSRGAEDGWIRAGVALLLNTS